MLFYKTTIDRTGAAPKITGCLLTVHTDLAISFEHRDAKPGWVFVGISRIDGAVPYEGGARVTDPDLITILDAARSVVDVTVLARHSDQAVEGKAVTTHRGLILGTAVGPAIEEVVTWSRRVYPEYDARCRVAAANSARALTAMRAVVDAVLKTE